MERLQVNFDDVFSSCHTEKFFVWRCVFQHRIVADFGYVIAVRQNALRRRFQVLDRVVNRKVVSAQIFHDIVSVKRPFQQLRTVDFRQNDVEREQQQAESDDRRWYAHFHAFMFPNLLACQKQEEQKDDVQHVKDVIPFDQIDDAAAQTGKVARLRQNRQRDEVVVETIKHDVRIEQQTHEKMDEPNIAADTSTPGEKCDAEENQRGTKRVDEQ